MIKQIVYCGITVASLVLVTKPPLVDAHSSGVTVGVVHSCVVTVTRGENKKGDIRIIGATETCRSGEAAVDWNASRRQPAMTNGSACSTTISRFTRSHLSVGSCFHRRC